MNEESVQMRGLLVPSRSMGLKLIVVCALAVFLAIPAVFVHALVEDRMRRGAEVTRQISARSGGQQIFLGPTLIMPLSGLARDTYVVSAAKASAVLRTATEPRRLSLFQVPVFKADLKFDAQFDLTGVPAAVPDGARLDWNRAEIVVGVSDPRGALADATLTTGGKTTELLPVDIGPGLGGSKLAFFGAPVDEIAKPDAKFSVSALLRFSGAQRVAVLAWGKDTRLTALGDWPSPGFDGNFLPARYSVTRSGFSAEWSIPYIARGVRAEGQSSSLAKLADTALGISFVEVADPYQSVSRSLKYALLFVGLVLLSYFVFEVTTGKRVHPAQYILVGIAQIIFYLLLLSLSERTGFGYGFLLAGASTVSLLSINAAWVFSSRLQGLRAFGCFSLLYGLIYLLLRMEDEALLVGAVASFLAIAAAMYLTRNIDWYSSVAYSSVEPPRDR